MIFDNMDFHNVEELEKKGAGYTMWRVPAALRSHLSQAAAETAARFATGIEIRFRMVSDTVTLTLRTEPMEEAQVAYIYFGSFQGGWQQSSKAIGQEGTPITISRPGNMQRLRELTAAQSLPFSPEIVRLVLPSGLISYVGVEGEVEPPAPEDLPEKTYLAYGSSITHGSLGLAMPFSYVFRISQLLGCDYLNMGLAGNALMEEEMAQYLCQRKDWDFASLEMGVNMLKESFSADFFEKRTRRFMEIFAQDGRPVFVTDVFGNNGEAQEKAEQFRQIVAEYVPANLTYVPGLELLDNPAFISQDMTHPTAEGQLQIGERWAKIMGESMQFCMQF